MPTTSLWPDFKFDSKPRGIRQMLEDAGQGLKEKTNGIVEFRVWPVDNINNRSYPFRYRCDLYVESLGYNFPLFHVNSSEIGFPAEVVTESGGITVNDESALRSSLETIFHSARTIAVIQNLMSMATE